jgi:hypothetical protein
LQTPVVGVATHFVPAGHEWWVLVYSMEEVE